MYSVKKTYGSFFFFDLEPKFNFNLEAKPLFLNTGRNAFEYILRIKEPKKVYLPALSCDALYTPLKRLNIDFEFYNVNFNYEPDFDYNKIGNNEYFLYINYYGLKNSFIKQIAGKIKNLILDNTQAFFGIIPENIPTFNSLRKFFGVPDGALLFNIEDKIELKTDKSAKRFLYLIQRLEQSSNEVYPLYRQVEEELDGVELKIMSESTKKVFESLPLDRYKDIRTSNFNLYYDVFSSLNILNIEMTEGAHFYPLYIDNGAEIKKELIKEGIYIANFWPNVFNNPMSSKTEYSLVANVIPLPIDHRYDSVDISHIISVVLNKIKASK